MNENRHKLKSWMKMARELCKGCKTRRYLQLKKRDDVSSVLFMRKVRQGENTDAGQQKTKLSMIVTSFVVIPVFPQVKRKNPVL